MNKIIEKPIFVVGCMRSGTTILADLLGMHPNIIHCPFELRSVWSRAGNVPMASPKTRDRKCPSLKETDVKPGQAVALSKAFFQEMLKNKGTKDIHNAFFLNKNPHLGNKLLFVNALFPNARFIWIYRDMPRVVASLKQIFNRKEVHYWPEKGIQEESRCWECFFNSIPAQINKDRCFPGGDTKYLAEYWYEANKAISDFSKVIPPHRLFLIKEEKLIEHPKKVLTDCQSFLGLSVSLPLKELAKIDQNRNNLWANRLSMEELESLLNFVETLGEKLNNVVPENDLFFRYKERLSDELFKRDLSQTKSL